MTHPGNKRLAGTLIQRCGWVETSSLLLSDEQWKMLLDLEQQGDVRAAQNDLSRGSVAKNSPVSAEDAGSIPGLGRFHMTWSNYTHAPPLESSPHLLHRKTPLSNQDSAQAKKNKIKKKALPATCLKMTKPTCSIQAPNLY